LLNQTENIPKIRLKLKNSKLYFWLCFI